MSSASKPHSVPNHAWLRGPAAWRRDMNFMERLLSELPDYIDAIPEEAREETVARMRRLRGRIDAFEEELARAGSHTETLKYDDSLPEFSLGASKQDARGAFGG